ncbi:energy transducer TonB [Pseudoalteromonas sp. B131b]|uniref:energy transducer TonB n=1 Tax=Pseudoalteromonas sp. B131b TaxID=630493 RepID=UPI00301B86C2
MYAITPAQKSRNIRHPLFAFALSLIVLTAALLLLWLAQLAEHIVQDKVIVREVAMVALPPPPPPSIQQQQANKPAQSLMVEGAGASIQAVKIKIKSKLKIVRPDTPSVKVSTPQWQSVNVNWDALSLNQLDGLPTLLTPVKALLPKSLTRQGIDTFTVKLDVLIDEGGNVSLIEVVQNPYPSLKPAIDKIIKQSRFSAPKKEGEAVRARFIWPIEFKP